MFSLSAAEIAKQGLTVLFTIYLARVLSPEGFGIIGFAKSFVAYFILIVTLGFETYGSREVAKTPDKLNKLVNTIFTIRFFLSLITYLIFAALVFLIDKSFDIKIVMLITGVNIISSAILLNWVFIGLEKMEIVALRQVIISVLNLAGIFIFVHNPGDTIIAVIVISISLAINSIWVLVFYVKYYGKIKFDFDIPFLKKILSSSFQIGLIYIFISFYNNLNISMLGFMSTNTETGIYSAAYAIVILAMVPAGIFQNAFFPIFSRTDLLEERRRIMNKFTLLTYLVGSFIAFSVMTYTDIVVIVLGSKYQGTGVVLKILMLSVYFMYINITYSSPLIAWKKEKQVFYSIIAGSITNIILNFILIPQYGAIGAAFGTLASEFAVLIGLTIVFVNETKTTFSKNLMKLTLVSAFSCGFGYLTLLLELNIFVSAILVLILFIGVIFATKIISIKELKSYFAK